MDGVAPGFSSVDGTIRTAKGKPAPNVVVTAYAVELRNERALGQDVTDNQGKYGIVYHTSRSLDNQTKSSHIKVTLKTSNGRSLHSPEVVFHAPIHCTIDKTLAFEEWEEEPEYDRLLKQVRDVLGDVFPGDLAEDDKQNDLSFVAGATSIPQAKVECLARAQKLGKEDSVDPEIPYALYCKGLLNDITGLLTRQESTWLNAVQEAITENVIHTKPGAEITAVVNKLRSVTIDAYCARLTGHLQKTLPVDPGVDVLRTVLTDPAPFVKTVLQHSGGSPEELWAHVNENPDITADADLLQFTIQLAALTKNHVPLVQEIQRLKRSGEVDSFTSLAKLSESDWQSLIEIPSVGVPNGTPGKDDAQKKQAYVSAVTGLIEDTVPTVYFANRLADKEDDYIHGKWDVKDQLASFLSNNPGFQINGPRISDYLEKDPSALKGQSDPQSLTLNLAGVQRLHSLSPRYKQIRPLIADGIHSGMQISRMGKISFVNKYRDNFGEDEANALYDKAHSAHAMAVNLLANYGPASRSSSFSSMLQDVNASLAGALVDIPDWTTLFGSPDMCACDGCHAIDSPAAYLVDLLAFLKDRPSTGAGMSAKEILFRRRPDIGDLDLSCENTNIYLPTIDLAIEILENAVAPPAKFTVFEVSSDLSTKLDVGSLEGLVPPAAGAPFSEYATVTTVAPNLRWLVEEPGFTFTLDKITVANSNKSVIKVSRRSLQTKGTPQERAAVPQYINPAAYYALNQQVYPSSMPFNLWSVTVTEYLKYLNVERYRLPQALSPSLPPYNKADISVVFAHLGLTVGEANIINGQTKGQAGATSVGPWNLYGFVEETLKGLWVDAVTSRVDVLIQRLGIDYSSLLSLVAIGDLFGPPRTLAIAPVAGAPIDTCQLDSLMLSGGNNADFLHRLLRFVRLWSRLEGWSINDLAKTMRALGQANPTVKYIDNNFLSQLSMVLRLQKELQLPLETLLSFWSPISTTTYQEFRATGEVSQQRSLYARLFQNQTTTRKVDSAFNKPPASLSGELSDNSAVISAALAISATEFEQLISNGRVVTDNKLSLTHLSALFRHVSLWKALALTLPDYLLMVRIVSQNKMWSSPFDTLAFVEQVRRLLESGFTIPETNYLLRHDSRPGEDVAVVDDEVAAALGQWRKDLHMVEMEWAAQSLSADESAAKLAKGLALLDWDARVVAEVVATLNDTASYSSIVTGSTPPTASITFPVNVQSKISYDPLSQRLTFVGVMTKSERELLQAMTGWGAEYKKVIDDLFLAPRAFLRRHMGRFSLPDYQVSLSKLPSDAAIAPTLQGRVYYDQPTQTLHSVGALTESDRQKLMVKDGSAPGQSAATFNNAVQALFDVAPGVSAAADDDDVFLLDTEVDQLFDNFSDAAARVGFVLSKLLPKARSIQIRQHLTNRVSLSMSIDTTISDYLLQNIRYASPNPIRLTFQDPTFVTSTTAITRERFSSIFSAFVLLKKISLIIRKLKLTVVQLKWIISYRRANPGDPSTMWLDLEQLPLTLSEVSQPLLTRWDRLCALVRLRDSIPNGEKALDAIFTKARAPDTREMAVDIAAHTRWPLKDVLSLDDSLKLNSPTDFKDEIALQRMLGALKLSTGLGCSAADLKLLSKNDNALGEKEARIAVQIVKAKYDQATWETVAKPIRDGLRRKQRSALVAYLLANPLLDNAGMPQWKTSNDLVAYFLIDVEAGSAPVTSRIKQAISSVQLFGQRCLMNLEVNVKPNTATDSRWLEWDSWMKSQAAHAANYRVFTHPENYLQANLRRDSTPAFQELQQELQQVDITDASAQAALKTYLNKLDDVASLDIVNFFQEVESSGAVTSLDIMHVIARTRTKPHIYYYRQRVDSLTWKGGWKKIDADIQGNHAFPAVWNKRLYIFWPEFAKKQVPPGKLIMPAANAEVLGSAPYWEIKLAWVQLRGDKWSAKAMSEQVITQPFIMTEQNFSFRVGVYGDVLDVECWNPRFLSFFRFSGNNTAPQAHLLDVSSSSRWAEGKRAGNHREQEYNTFFRFLYGVELWEVGEVGTEVRFFGLNPFKKAPNQVSHKPWRVITSAQDVHNVSQRPMFFAFDERTYLVDPVYASATELSLAATTEGKVVTTDVAGTILASSSETPFSLAERPEPTQALWCILPAQLAAKTTYRFSIAYNPFVTEFISAFNRNGINGLLSRDLQLLEVGRSTPRPSFKDMFDPSPVTAKNARGEYVDEVVDFDYGAYAIYNWELFFHIPLLMAERLNQNQRFADAQKWFHYIFNPTDTSGNPSPQRFWQTGIFFKTQSSQYAQENVPAVLRFLAKRGNQAELDQLSADQRTLLNNMEISVRQWRREPFQPYLVANTRPTAFQKAVVMKYLDNLLAWGDQLFAANTIEKINEATQLYIMASDILGKRPVETVPRFTPEVQTYNTMEPRLDSLSNALVRIEELVRPLGGTAVDGIPPGQPSILYFCAPKNTKLWSYWDTVTDRLFKIRNSMNLQGQLQQLPLYDPPIDPALLVKAAAAGVDISSTLNDINVTQPRHRYAVLRQKALEFCNDLKTLGNSFLAFLEKKDVEGLNLLRSKHELSTFAGIKAVKALQISEARESLEAATRNKATVQERYNHYAELQFMNIFEFTSFELIQEANDKQEMLSLADLSAHTMSFFPDIKFGSPTTIGATYGGTHLASAARMAASSLRDEMETLMQKATRASTIGGYDRRAEEWALQRKVAMKELDQLDKQVVAAEVRLAIAEKDAENFELQAKNAQEIDDYMHSKFNSFELYDWMVGQLSTGYFHSYRMAFEMAKRAESAYRYELGLQTSNFVQFGYWDSLKKGLLAGEKLHQDLQRMEMAHLELKQREYEMSTNISLAQLDPVALVQLRESQEAFFALPEAIFDLSSPGHYFRRIKSVNITIPCIVGPYTSVNCTLSLLKSSVRTSNTLSGAKYGRQSDDIRFIDAYGQVQSIVTSTAQSDFGLFETNSRGEDYLPFEGSGAISSWRIQLPKYFKQFDYRTISDVIINVRYTAREGGELLRQTAAAEMRAGALKAISLAESHSGLARLLSLKYEYSNNWYRFLHKPDVGAAQQMTIDLTMSRFPFIFRDAAITIDKIQLFVFIKKEFLHTHNAGTLKFTLDTADALASGELALAPWDTGERKTVLRASKTFGKAPGMWKLGVRLATGTKIERVNADALEDVLFVVGYSVTMP